MAVLTLAAVALAVLAPFFVNAYQLYIINLVFIYILLTTSLNLLLGHAGQLAFSTIALYGVGAYTTGLLKLHFAVPYWIGIPAGGAMAVAVGVLSALPALRLQGLYLALSTVAFAEMAHWVFANWTAVTNGVAGIILPRADFGFLGLGRETGVYYASFAVMAISVLLVRRVLRSRIGRSFVALRDNEVTARSLGMNATLVKTQAYGVSAALAGLAGGLFAMLLGVVSPESFLTIHMIFLFAMVIVGGLGTLAGSVIGAMLLVWLMEALRVFQELQELAYGVVLLLAVIFLPVGVFGFAIRLRPGLQEPLRRSEGSS